MNQRLWGFIGLVPGLAGLQSRRLTAMLVSDCAPDRLSSYRACRPHSTRLLRCAHPRPQRARDRDPTHRGMQELPGSTILLVTARDQFKVGDTPQLLRF